MPGNAPLTNICLVGFMGTGKTSVGRKVAAITGKEFIECDELIVKKAKKSIPLIFSEDGEIRFRELEIEIMKEASKMENCVFSTGGGVVLNNINLLYVRMSSVVILLEASPSVIFSRVMVEGKEKRPMIAKPDPRGEIDKLLAFRDPFYKAATGLRVDTSSRSLDEVAALVVQLYAKNKDARP